MIFVYREEYYLAEQGAAAPARPNTRNGSSTWCLVHGKAEVIIGKQRHGPDRHGRVQFEGQFTRFSDLRAGRQLAGSRASDRSCAVEPARSPA